MGHVRAVAPLPGYRILIEFDTGSSITVDLSPKLKTARFAELADPQVFNQVRVECESVIWGNGILRLSLFELIDVAISGV